MVDVENNQSRKFGDGSRDFLKPPVTKVVKAVQMPGAKDCSAWVKVNRRGSARGLEQVTAQELVDGGPDAEACR